MVVKNKKHEDSKVWAFLGVFLGLIGFLIVLLTRKEDKYAMYYAKMGLVLTIAWVILAIINIIPVVGWVIYLVGGIALLVLWVIAFIAALSGEEKKVFLLSDIAAKINL